MAQFRRTTVGTLIRQLREREGWTQGQLAAKANVKRSWLSHVELGHRERPEREMLEAVARALRVPPETILAAAGYRATPLPPPEEPTVEDLLRRAQVQYQKLRPMRVPKMQQRVAAGYLSGGAVNVEYIEYTPREVERKHKLIAVDVAGTCLEPRLMDGHTAIIDLDAAASEGDIVLAIHEGEAILKELRSIDGRPHLVALQGQAPIPANGETRIVGKVIKAEYRP